MARTAETLFLDSLDSTLKPTGKEKSIVPVRIRRFEMAPLIAGTMNSSGTLLGPHWGGTPAACGAHSSPPASAFTFWINQLLAGLPA